MQDSDCTCHKQNQQQKNMIQFPFGETKGLISIFKPEALHFSPLQASLLQPWFFHQLKSPTAEHFEIVRCLFYLLDEQINPIVSHTSRQFDSQVPHLFARLMIDLQYEQQQQLDLICEPICNEELVEDVCVDGKEAMLERMKLLKQLPGSNLVKQYAASLYVAMLSECYMDEWGKTFIVQYVTEIERLCHVHKLESVLAQEWQSLSDLKQDLIESGGYSDEHYLSYAQEIVEYENQEQFLQRYLLKCDLETYESAVTALLQYRFRERKFGGSQLRQLSFGFKEQTPFGDCQELGLFELFINHALYNCKTKCYDTTCISDKCCIESELLDMIHGVTPAMVNCLSFRRKWHTYLQGKPTVFQYVNHDIFHPELDYEVNVTVANALSAAEYFLGVHIPEFDYIRHKLRLKDMVVMREKVNQSSTHKFTSEEFKMFQESQTRYTLERGYTREKKALEKALKSLGSLLSSEKKTFSFELNRSSKQNHSLVIMTVEDHITQSKYQVIQDMYGAHVATLVPERKNEEMTVHYIDFNSTLFQSTGYCRVIS